MKVRWQNGKMTIIMLWDGSNFVDYSCRYFLQIQLQPHFGFNFWEHWVQSIAWKRRRTGRRLSFLIFFSLVWFSHVSFRQAFSSLLQHASYCKRTWLDYALCSVWCLYTCSWIFPHPHIVRGTGTATVLLYIWVRAPLHEHSPPTTPPPNPPTLSNGPNNRSSKPIKSNPPNNPNHATKNRNLKTHVTAAVVRM